MFFFFFLQIGKPLPPSPTKDRRNSMGSPLKGPASPMRRISRAERRYDCSHAADNITDVKGFALQMSHDQEVLNFFFSSLLLLWIKLIVLSCFFMCVYYVAVHPERKEVWSKNHLQILMDTRFESEGESRGATTHFIGPLIHSFNALVQTPAYSQDALLNRSPATLPLETNASFSFRGVFWSCTVDSNWCWAMFTNWKKKKSADLYLTAEFC